MSTNYEGKLIDLSEYKKQKYNGNMEIDYDQLWAFPDYYEYCIIPFYEDKFTATHLDAIDIGGCFANILKEGDKYILVSLIFSDEMTIPEILEWLDYFKLELYPPTKETIQVEGADLILEAVAFHGCPLVLSERGAGTQVLNPAKLEEVTEEYEKHNRITNTGIGEQVNIDDHIFD